MPIIQTLHYGRSRPQIPQTAVPTPSLHLLQRVDDRIVDAGHAEGGHGAAEVADGQQRRPQARLQDEEVLREAAPRPLELPPAHVLPPLRQLLPAPELPERPDLPRGGGAQAADGAENR